MQRLVIIVCAALGATPTAAAQPAASPDTGQSGPPDAPRKSFGLNASADFFTRYELRENYADVGLTTGRISEFDATVYRARLGLATDAIDIGGTRSVLLRFVPQVSGYWGDRGATLVDAPLQVHEAVMRVASGKFWVDVGRFEMIYGDHFVIGNVDWHETARSFDGVRAHLPIGARGAWLEVFATQVDEGLRVGATSTVAQGDLLFTGAYLALGPSIAPGTDVDAYVLAHKWIGAEQEVSPEVTIGGRYKTRAGAIDARVEAGIQVGKRPGLTDSTSVFAFQGEGELGVHAGAARVAAGGFFASGDDPDTETDEAWNQLYPTAHKWLGLMDIIGPRSNVMGAMAKLGYRIDSSLTVGADAHVFWRPQTIAGVDSFTGVELDTYALKKLGKGLTLRGGYHVFAPNETGPLGSSNLVHYAEVMLRFRHE